MSSSHAVSVADIPASMHRRAGAYAIDIGVAVAIPLMLVSMLAGAAFGLDAMVGETIARSLRGLVPLLLVASCVGWVIAYNAMQGGSGSIGQRLVGLRLADADTGADIGFGRALARNVVFHLAAVIIVGLFSPLLDRSPRRRGWHDLAAGVCVVDIRGREVAVAPAPPSASALAPIPAPAYGAPVNSAPAHSAPTPGAAADECAECDAADDTAPETASRTPVGRLAQADAEHPALAVLTWDDGSRMAVYERTVCGRNPAREDGVLALALRDETLSMSKTHFEIGGDPAGAWIIDRFSTNGTHRVRDGERIGLVAGRATALRPGDRLEFGDRSVVVGGGSA